MAIEGIATSFPPFKLLRRGKSGSKTARFAFGQNWKGFLTQFSEDRLQEAKASLSSMLQTTSLNGKTFLDIGSGSGLFSLAARESGALVTSFDLDKDSVACTESLKESRRPHDTDWKVSSGSILDTAFLNTLGKFDIVYSWGVLHHTGNLTQALKNAQGLVKPGGQLYISIYNDQGTRSFIWTEVKTAYNAGKKPTKASLLALSLVCLWGPPSVRDLLVAKPFQSWRSYGTRGMSPWYDLVDWIGGYPFEVAKPEVIIQQCREAGFVLDRLKTCGGGLGCNEYVFSLPATAEKSS